MALQSAREQLLDFLDVRVFQPALRKQPLSYASADDRKLLKSVQERIQRSRTRYIADYPTASDVKANFAQDVNSEAGQILAWEMGQLRLARFQDVRDEFLALCVRLGL